MVDAGGLLSGGSGSRNRSGGNGGAREAWRIDGNGGTKSFNEGNGSNIKNVAASDTDGSITSDIIVYSRAEGTRGTSGYAHQGIPSSTGAHVEHEQSFANNIFGSQESEVSTADTVSTSPGQDDQGGTTRGETRAVHIGSTLPNKAVGKPAGRKWRESFTKKCEARLPLLKTVFASNIVEDQIGARMMALLEEPFGDLPAGSTVEGISPEVVGRIIGLKFSRNCKVRSGGWSTEAGQVQSAFRKELARAVLEHVQSPLREWNQVGGGETMATSDAWFGSNSMALSIIMKVHNRKEKGATKRRRGLRDGPVGTPMVLDYAAEYLYKQISAVLVRSRRRSAESLFGNMCYCFVDWKLYSADLNGTTAFVDQSTMRFSFPGENDGGFGNVPVQQIPDNVRNGENSAVAGERLRLLKSAMAKYNCDITHDKLCRDGEGFTAKRRMVKVDFVNMAIRFLVTFSFGTDEEMLLQASHSSLRVVSAVAYGLFRIVRQFAEEWGKHGAKVFGEIDKVQYEGLKLASLLPGEFRIRTVMKGGKCLVEK